MRRARVALLTLVPVVSTFVLASPAAATDQLPSSTCGGGTIIEAYTGPGGNFATGFSYFQEYVRVDVVQSGTSTTICYVLDVHEYGVIQHRGGWIRIDGVTASVPPPVDGDTGYCRRNSGTAGSPAVAGSLGDPSDPPSVEYYLRALVDNAGAHLCVELGRDIRAHVQLGLPGIVGTPAVDHAEDPPYDSGSNGPQPPSPTPPPGGSESSACQSTDTSTWRIVRVLGFSAFTANEHGSSPDLTCYRVNTPAGGVGWTWAGWGGGLEGGVDWMPYVQPSCTVLVARGDSPVSYTIWRSPTGTVPAHLCVVSPVTPGGMSVTYDPVSYSPPDPTRIRFDA